MVTNRAALVSTLLGVALLAGGPERGRADQAVDAQIFKPALDPNGIFSVERAQAPKQWDFALRVVSSFAQAPLKLDSVAAVEGDDTIIDSTLLFNVGFSLGLTDRLVVGFDTPFGRQPLGKGYGDRGVYRPVADPMDAQPGTGFYSIRPDQNIDPSETPVGDVRLGLKYQLLRGATGLALQGVAYVPFGDEDVFAGSNGFSFEPKLILERAIGKRAVLALNAGARIRDGVLVETRRVDDGGYLVDNGNGEPIFDPLLFVGTEALLSAGVRVAMTHRVAVAGEAYGLVPLDKAELEYCPEDVCRNGDATGGALLGAVIGVTDDVSVSIGAGAGLGFLSDAARSESFRVLGGVTWAPAPAGARRDSGRDADGDLVPDALDVCRDEPEDADGFQDDDGCPELDNDLDGVLDAQDRCPAEPEDRDGFEDDDGCADSDNDGDGVSDLTDMCPLEREDADGFADQDGCPDEDNDGDGLVDDKDQCPNEAETVNGYQDEDGCADVGLVGGPRIATDRIDLQGERIDFEGQTAKIAKASQPTLDAIAALLVSSQGSALSVRIEVGVERSGDKKPQRDRDRRLSQERADAVYGYLVGKGVAMARLQAVGLGSDRPLDPKNPRDPKLNRRVDFIRITQ